MWAYLRYEIKKMSEIKTWVYMQITLFKKWMHLSANKKSNIIWQNRYEKIFGLSAKESAYVHCNANRCRIHQSWQCYNPHLQWKKWYLSCVLHRHLPCLLYTSDNIKSPHKNMRADIATVWCYCYHLRSFSNLRDLIIEDNLNNTFR